MGVKLVKSEDVFSFHLDGNSSLVKGLGLSYTIVRL